MANKGLSLSERGRKGGKAKVKKGFAVTGDAKEKGSAGGKAKARKYQDPNFDKEFYQKRRDFGKRGQGDKPRTIVSQISPQEYQRRIKQRSSDENS